MAEVNLAQAAALLGFAGRPVPDVRFGGSACVAVAELDVGEHARRRALGLGALADARAHYHLVEALFDLPHGIPVAWDDIDPAQWPELGAAPPGVLRWSSRAVERQWRPALRVSGVLVVAGRLRPGLQAIGPYSADAPRGVVTARRPHQGALAEAARHGIGVAAPGRHGWCLLLASQRRPRAITPRHWRFLETVYEALLRDPGSLGPHGAAAGGDHARVHGGTR